MTEDEDLLIHPDLQKRPHGPGSTHRRPRQPRHSLPIQRGPDRRDVRLPIVRRHRLGEQVVHPRREVDVREARADGLVDVQQVRPLVPGFPSCPPRRGRVAVRAEGAGEAGGHVERGGARAAAEVEGQRVVGRVVSGFCSHFLAQKTHNEEERGKKKRGGYMKSIP